MESDKLPETRDPNPGCGTPRSCVPSWRSGSLSSEARGGCELGLGAQRQRSSSRKQRCRISRPEPGARRASRGCLGALCCLPGLTVSLSVSPVTPFLFMTGHSRLGWTTAPREGRLQTQMELLPS